MIKKAIIKRKLFEYLDQKVEEGINVNEDYILANVKELYDFLMSQPDDLLGGFPYSYFVEVVQQKYVEVKTYGGSFNDTFR